MAGNNNLHERLRSLLEERDTGRRVLAELQGRQREVTETLLRIDGAVQVLEELIGNGTDDGSDEPDLPGP